jgi:hypothetical protein
MREFSDLKPFDDIPTSFCLFRFISASLGTRSRLTAAHDGPRFSALPVLGTFYSGLKTKIEQ